MHEVGSGKGASDRTQPSSAQIRDALGKFEHRLSELTKVPPNKLGDFMAWPEDRLKLESKAVTKILKRFAAAVVDSTENIDHADKFLRELDLRSVSRDHDWRAIFSTIRAQEAGYDGYKRAVLVKYLQYLSFRKRLIEYVTASRRGLEETEEYSDITLFALRFGAEQAKADPHGRPGDTNFVRLPLGESVDLELPHGHDVSIMLAAHVYRLSGERPPTLVDQNGVTYMLKSGRNMIGRHPDGDVVIDPNFSDVSRAHVIFEWNGDGLIRLIDFSSRGTYVHRDALQRPGDGSSAPAPDSD